jgi:poly-gamma-glutamate synthesis protein (capsule biosynthesis protein)
MVVLVAASVLGGYHFYRIYICGDTEPKTTNVAESKNEDKKEDKEVDKKKDKDENKEKDKEKDKDENEKKNEEKDIKKSVKISAVGDCTIGWQDRFDPEKRFDAYLEKNDGNYGYYLEKVKDVFKNDDLTIVNLEGTFTKNLDKVEKEYNFSAPQEYTKVLTSGNVDIASFANNHTHDYNYRYNTEEVCVWVLREE